MFNMGMLDGNARHIGRRMVNPGAIGSLVLLAATLASSAGAADVKALRCEAATVRKEATFLDCLARCEQRGENRAARGARFDRDACHATCEKRLDRAADRLSCAPTDGPTTAEALSLIGTRTPQFTCGTLMCSCKGDADCNDMFSTNVCGPYAICIDNYCYCFRARSYSLRTVSTNLAPSFGALAR